MLLFAISKDSLQKVHVHVIINQIQYRISFATYEFIFEFPISKDCILFQNVKNESVEDKQDL